ncbi:hypothetical protein ACFUCV_02410 [Specibacter sp. NPDC057265]|uniref:hypothetical protein n=1 Tax=Specibacter sp. NPDC057265 TaxID=3346075 RepID=UPI0036459AB8
MGSHHGRHRGVGNLHRKSRVDKPLAPETPKRPRGRGPGPAPAQMPAPDAGTP